MIENLIEFLEKKALEIINSFKDSDIDNKKKFYNYTDPKKLKSLISEGSQNLFKKQTSFNNIMQLLIKISDIGKNDRENYNAEHKIGKIFESYIKDILRQPAIYDKNHPLFGYPEFEKLILERCIKTEAFEICAKLTSIDNT